MWTVGCTLATTSRLSRRHFSTPSNPWRWRERRRGKGGRRRGSKGRRKGRDKEREGGESKVGKVEEEKREEKEEK